MKMQFSKLAFKNALISLIPVFPIWTLFPGILAANVIEKICGDCETSYLLVLGIMIPMSFLTLFKLFKNVNGMISEDTLSIKGKFRMYCLLLYTLFNTIGLVLIIGINLACRGDGQTILACIYSGPIASILLVCIGMALDLKIKVTGANSLHM